MTNNLSIYVSLLRAEITQRKINAPMILIARETADHSVTAMEKRKATT